MDDYDLFALQALGFAAVQEAPQRLALLPLDEAHDLLRFLVAVARIGRPRRSPPVSCRRTDRV
ncbi:DUF6417 family protein [Streptomyces sp. JNUCC 63]